MQSYPPVGPGFQADRRVRGALLGWAQAGGEVGVGGVQPPGQFGEVGLGRIGQAQRGQDLRAGLLPRAAVQEPGPRVTPPDGACRVHISAAQRPVERLEHAQRVGPVVDRARTQVGVGEHQAAPRPAHHVLHDVRGADPPTRGQLRQTPHGGEDGLPGVGRGERHELGEHRQERTDRGVTLHQFRPLPGVGVLVGARDQPRDRGHRGGQALSGHGARN